MKYSEDIVQYGSELSELILVPNILELIELHWGECTVSVSVHFASFVCFSVSDQCMQVRSCAL